MEGNKINLIDTFSNCSESKNCKKTKPKENHLSAFEIFCLRFPIPSGNIFKIMDDKNLADCNGISRTLRKFYNEERFYWIRVIQKYWETLEEFSESWKTVIHQTPNEIVKELATALQEFFQLCSENQKQWSPLHVAADRGHLRLCQFITERTGEINPRQNDGTTALEMAAEEGHSEVCICINTNCLGSTDLASAKNLSMILFMA